MSIAVSGQTVLFEHGDYTVANGNDFTQPIPDGLSLQAREILDGGSLEFEASGSETLKCLGAVKMKNLTFSNFELAELGPGKQELTDVAIRLTTGSLLLTKGAKFSCSGCALEGDRESRQLPLIVGQDSSRLELTGGTRVTTYCSSWSMIYLEGSAEAHMHDVVLGGGLTTALELQNSGQVRLSYLRIATTCGYGISAGGRNPVQSGDIEIANSHVTRAITFNQIARLRIRDSTFSGFGGLLIQGDDLVVDLGKPGDAGNNTFLSGLVVAGRNNTVNASGNTWLELEQGADAAGHYPAGTIITTALGNADGPNMSIADFGLTGSQIQL